MFKKLKGRLEKKAVSIVARKAEKYMIKKNSSWKTTLAGIITGGSAIANALIDAYNQGQFTGKTGTTLIIGIGIVVIGVLSKDADKTGLPVQDASNTVTKTAI